MRTDASNLTGIWHGLYTYSSGSSVSFVATLIDSGGFLGGSTHETSIWDSGLTICAMLEGSRDGRAVSFLKTYQNAGPSYDAPIRYRGTLSDDATEIEGRWTISSTWSGKFLMVRQGGGGRTDAIRAGVIHA
jgi:hypothetical protein